MKKKIILFAMMILCMAVSCEKVAVPCRLSVRVEGDGMEEVTKVTGQTGDNEGGKNDIQVFVFNSVTGKLDMAGHMTSSVSFLECSQGPREIWALVNSPKDYISGENAIADLTSFLSITTRLTDNTSSSFVMAGKVNTTLSSTTENVTIEVFRQVAAVYLKSVVNDMYVPAYQVDNKVKIVGMFLGNVPGYQKLSSLDGYAAIPASGIEKNLWISPNVKDTDPAKLALTSDSVNEYVRYTKELSTRHTLYSYPNDAPSSESDIWSPRATMLVVEAIVDGQPCLYPVQLGTLEANTKYEVSLIIHRIGRVDGKWWIPVKFDAATPIISVKDWKKGTTVNEEI